MGEPNSLVKDSKGTWHLFYNYNPSNTTPAEADNGHWGHATSADGYKWENQPIALWPPAGKGSVVADPDNKSGLFGNGTGENLVAVYESGSGVQLAHSPDGNNFTPQNGSVAEGVKDPKVFKNGDAWVMTSASDAGVVIHTSPDLKNWTKASEVPAGQVSSPNLVKVGDKWALLASNDQGQQYWTGDFNGTHFTPAGDAKKAEWGGDGHGGAAAVDGDNTIWMTWAGNAAYADKTPTDGEFWRGTMSVPRLLSMANGTDGPVLAQVPLNPGPVVGKQVAAAKSDKGKLAYTFDGAAAPSGAMLLLLNVSGLEGAGAGHTVNWTFFSADKKEWLESGYVFDGTAWIRRGKVGGFAAEGFTQNLNTTYTPAGGSMSVAAIVDRSILETYLDEGKSVATNLFFSNGSLSQVGVWADVPENTTVEAHVFALNSSWANATQGGGEQASGGEQAGGGAQAVSDARPPETGATAGETPAASAEAPAQTPAATPAETPAQTPAQTPAAPAETPAATPAETPAASASA